MATSPPAGSLSGTSRPSAAPPKINTGPPAAATHFPARSYNAVLSGKVTNAKTGSPVSGAVVAIGMHGKEARTSAFGDYRITFPSGASVPVTVSMQGYYQLLAMGTLRAHQHLVENFRLTPITPGQPSAPPPPALFGAR